MTDKTHPTAHAEITAPISADLRRIEGASPVSQAVRLLREAAAELKNCHTIGGDWGGEIEALDAYNEHMAVAATLEQTEAGQAVPAHTDAPIDEPVTKQMIDAGAKAAREYMARTGGNNLTVIYRAMRAVAPAGRESASPAQEHATQLASQGLEPSPPVAVTGPVEWPATCDGLEQEAWEAWARVQRFDMVEHPMHYLFLNERTDAARQGWKGGLVYAVEQMKQRVHVVDAAPAQAQEDACDAERFRAMANAAITEDAVFGECLERLGGDCKTIDDIRAVFDAARAAQGGDKP